MGTESEIKKIKIKELPQTTSISNDDIFVESDTLETYKVTADDIAKYISENDHVANKYVSLNSVGVADGVAPLNSNKKINGEFITYGTSADTAYEGSNGKILEQNLDNHLIDEDAHGYNTKISEEIARASEAENALTSKLNSEISRAKSTESTIATNLNNEIIRSTTAEKVLTDNLAQEITNRTNADTIIATDLTNEITRAQAAEKNNSDAIIAEVSRATTKEDELSTDLTNEISRAKSAESNLDTKKANITSPTLTGTPKAPTASAGTNTTQIATTAFVQTAVSNHNASTAAHSDMRDLISGLTTRLNALADSDDTTLDQLSEIVTYIKSNRTLIDSITTNKINVSDIVDSLTSTATNKPLSANQGKVLNDLIGILTETVNAKVDGVKGSSETAYRTGNVNITPENIGLGNVPNVATNNQTPTYTEATSLTKLTSGEKLSTAFGKIAKAITDLISHIGDTVKHITSTERTNWTTAYTHSTSAHAPSGAEVNQNAFSNVVVGNTTIAADSKTDTLAIAAGSNITLTSDVTNNKLTIAAKDTVYTHPSYTAKSSGLYKITVDGTGHVSAATAVAKADITALGIPSSDTNTHYTSKNVVANAATGTTNTTTALVNGNVYLNSVENGAVTSAHKISGSGATTVTTDANGNIIVKSTDTNSTYTLDSFGITATAAELNYCDGVTSNIQTQLDSKAPSSHGTHVPATCTTITDWDSATSTGWYMARGAANAPTGAGGSTWYFGYVIAYSSNYVYQEVYQFTASTDAKAIPKYIRAKMNGAWGGWVNVTIAKAVPSDAVFTDTVYTHPTTTGNKHIPSGGSAGQILRWSADGTAVWGADNNTTYSVATINTAGLMSATDKSKLDGIAMGANAYTLPTASSTLGGVKTTSTVTSTSGLTACPIISGVPYYKDTNTTYTSLKSPYAININGTSYDGSSAKDIDLLPFIVGTQTAATGAWTGNAPSIAALFDGLTIRYWLPYAGSGNATLNLTLADGTTTGALNCYYSGTTRLTTHYAAGNVIELTYRSGVSISGSSTTYTGWWAKANYDSGNTKNTAGSTNTSSKIFLIGATSQATNPTTYSQDTVYVGTDGCLYSNSTRVVSEIVSTTEPANQIDGDYWLLDH